MTKHTQCFGRRDVSDKERRLLRFGFETGGGSPGDERAQEDREIKKIRANAEREKQGLSRSYQAFVDRETERTINQIRTGGLSAYYQKMSVPELRFRAAKADALARGAVQDKYMDNAFDSTPAGKKQAFDERVDARLRQQYQENATQRGYDRQLAEGTPRWQTDFFKSHSFDRRVQAIQHWQTMGIDVPIGILEQHGLAPNKGVTYVSTAVPAGPAYAPTAPAAYVPAAPVVMPGAPFRPRIAGQPTYAPVPAAGVSIDYSAGLPDKVLPTRAGVIPKKPSAFHMYDVYTGGWRLDQHKVQSTNNLAEYEARSQQFRATVDAADNRFNAVLESLNQKIAASSGPEREAYLAVFNNYVARRAADAERLIGQAQRLSDDVQKGVADPRNMQAVNGYQRDVQHHFAWQMYLAQNAPQAIDALAQQCAADVQNIDVAIFQKTQLLFDEFAKAYVPAMEVASTSDSVEEIKGLALPAIAKLEEFGSHLYRNVRGRTVPPEVVKAYEDNALRTVKALYGENKDDLVEMLTVPADESGIQRLLALRSRLLAHTVYSYDDDDSENITLQTKDTALIGRLLNSARAEKRYLQQQTPSDENDERIDTATVREERSIEDISTVLAEATNEAMTGGDMQALYQAASKELYFLKTNLPESDRIDELDNRSDDQPGIVQLALRFEHDPLREATDARLTGPLADPAAIRAALQDLRAEGRFLFRHRGTMTPAMEARVDELVGAQGQLSVNLAAAQLNAVGRDNPVARAAAVTELTRELATLEAHPANAGKAAELRAILSTAASELRGGVNVAIDAARNAKDADPRARAAVVDKALQAINAEIDALTALKLDPERITNLRAETSLLDSRVAIRAEAEKALNAGPKQSADIESFRRVFGLLESEDEAIRMAYAKNPEAMQQKLDALAQRKVAFKNTIDSALAASLQRVGAATTVAEVDRASALLRASLQLQLGAIDPNASIMDLAKRLPKPADFSAAKAAYEKIEGARQAAAERQADNERISAKMRKDIETPVPTAPPTLTRGVGPKRSTQSPTTSVPNVTLPEPVPSPPTPPPVNMQRATTPAAPAVGPDVPAANTPKAANPDIAPVTPGPTPALSPVVPPEGPVRVPVNGPEQITAAERAKDEAPIRQADALLAEAETSLAAGNAGTIEELDRRITSLRQASETMDAWRERFAAEQKQMFVEKADAWKVRFLETEDKLMAALGKSLANLGDPVNMQRAATLLDMRFRQLQVEDDARIDDFRNRGDAPSRDITAARQRLWDDLNGSIDSLLPKAIAIDMPAAVIDRLQAIAKQLAADPSIIRNG